MAKQKFCKRCSIPIAFSQKHYCDGCKAINKREQAQETVSQFFMPSWAPDIFTDSMLDVRWYDNSGTIGSSALRYYV